MFVYFNRQHFCYASSVTYIVLFDYRYGYIHMAMDRKYNIYQFKNNKLCSMRTSSTRFLPFNKFLQVSMMLQMLQI